MKRDFHPNAPKRLPGRQPTRRGALYPRGSIRSLLDAHQTPNELAKALERAKAKAEEKRQMRALGVA